MILTFESESISSSSSEEVATVEPVIESEKREDGQSDSVTEVSNIKSESQKIATEKPVEKEIESESTESSSFGYGQMNSTEIIDFNRR